MKKYFSALLLLLFWFSNLHAYDFSAESPNGQYLYYFINSDGSSITLTYPGSAAAHWDGYNIPTGNIIIPHQVSHEGVLYAVTAIGDNALSDCGTISSLTIPHSITSIAENAFSNSTIDTLIFNASACTSRLKKDIFGHIAYLHVGGSVAQIPAEAFKDDSLLRNVIFDSLTSIGVRSFKNCIGLQTITLPATLTNIGAEAFSLCDNLVEVRYLGTLSEWCEIAFGDSLANPISQSHHLNINGNDLQRLSIPDDISSIPNYTFYGCSGIQSITLPSNVTDIAAYSFTNINPDTLYFYASNCDARLAKRTFGNVKHLFVGGNVTAVGTGCFANDTVLSTVSIESAHNIGMYAFRNCINLDTLNLGTAIDSIHNSAFANCSNLYTINELRMEPPHLASDAFSNTPTDKTINIPCGSLSAYQNSWTGGGILSEPNTFIITTNTTDSTMGYTESTQPDCLNPIATIEAHPYYGYRFLCWNDSDTTNPRDVVVTQDTIFTAHFAPNSYTVNVLTSDSTQGTVSGGGVVSYLGITTLVATPIEHHHFLYWQDGNTDNPRQLAVTYDTQFVAFFAIDSHYVSMHCNDEYGTLSGGGIYPYGDTIILTAQAYPHHHFECWQDGDTNNPRHLIVTQDLDIEGIFLPDNYSIVLQSNNPHYGTTSGAGSYPYGTLVTLTAIPSDHYHFSQWDDGVTQNPRQITIFSDTIFVAIFSIDSHSVVLAVDDATHGSVEGEGSFAYGSLVQISATAFDGYTFTGWSNGATENPYQLSLISDTLLTAQFATTESIANINGERITLRTIGHYIYLDGAAGESLQIYDLSARMIIQGIIKDNYGYAVPQKGIYFIKIGKLPAQKVIVP